MHRLKVALDGMKPPVWRRVVVPSEITLGSLHEVIQVLFGWYDSHLHDFRDPVRGGRRWAPAEYLNEGFTLGFPGESRDLPEEEWALADVLPAEGGKLYYTYDLGDDWRHTVAVEEIRPARPDETGRARCVGGRRAMPHAEDTGGAWVLGLALERYADGERPHGVRHGRGRQAWTEYDDPTDELLADWYARDFAPAAFDAAELDDRLARLPLRQQDRGTPPGRADADADLDARAVAEALAELLGEGGMVVPPVRLPGVTEVAAAVRAVPLFGAALRLADWCAREEPALTPKGVLRPALARRAVEEAELWRLDPERWGTATAAGREERAGLLTGRRSAGDMPMVAEAWDFATAFDLIATAGGKVVAGPALPTGEEAAGDAELVDVWQRIVGLVVADLALTPPETSGVLSVLAEDLCDELPPVALLVLLAAYALPEGAWLRPAVQVAELLSEDGADVAGGGRAAQAARAREVLSQVLVLGRFQGLADHLVALGAARIAGVDGPAEGLGGAVFEADADEVEGRVGVSVTPARGGLSAEDAMAEPFGPAGVVTGALEQLASGPAAHFRLTPLGRVALRDLLERAGVIAPAFGALADAEAAELLTALQGYPSADEARTEADGWLARRAPADAAVAVIDACAGTEPADAQRRACASVVLDRLLAGDGTGDGAGRVERVLREAAASRTEGCAHSAAAALALAARAAQPDEITSVHWLLVDALLLFEDDAELLREVLEAQAAAPHPVPTVLRWWMPTHLRRALEDAADEVWRSGHPGAAEALHMAGDAVAPLDRRLGKRLRKAAFKARTAPQVREGGAGDGACSGPHGEPPGAAP